MVCISGAGAAEVFYEPDRFTRVGALPRSTLRLLQDEGSVTTLDGDAQRHRKHMFMSVMTPESIGEIAGIVTRRWREALPAWSAMPDLVLRDEVRRFYPFVPFPGGRVREPFAWRDHRFGPDDWVMLDVYGTNRDPHTWNDPDRFDPDRFVGRSVSLFELIPQGGSDHDTGHRCAGEWLTIGVMIAATRLLVDGTCYEAPPQDLSVRLSKMLVGPESGFVIANVQAA